MPVEIDQRRWGHAKSFLSKVLPDEVYRGVREAKNRIRAIGHYPIVERVLVDGNEYLFSANNYIERSLVCRDDEFEFLKRMRAVIETTDVVYDIGASVGIHTLPLAQKAHQVYAFEPFAGFTQSLQRNLQLNQMTNVTVLQVALGERDETRKLIWKPLSNRIPRLLQPGEPVPKFARQRNLTIRSIASLTCDTILPPEVIKIDAEGEGFGILKGMDHLTPRHIFMEIHPDMGENLGEILSFLNGRGYTEQSLTPRGRQYHGHFVHAA